LLPDRLWDQSGNSHRFAWLSGNYVLPEYRRKGISTQLLKEAEARWEGQLMYTNYAPASKAVYDRTERFHLLSTRKGARFYLRAASAELLKNRLGDSRLLASADQLINQLVNRRLKRYSGTSPTRGIFQGEDHPAGEFIVTRMEEMDRSVATLIEECNTSALFRRDAGVFKWILRFPWITDAAVPGIPYHFSYRADHFENLIYRIETEHGKELGAMWLLVHDRKLSVPYLFMNNEKLLPFMARMCMDTMVKRGLTHLTVRHDGLSNELRLFRKWFLAARNMPQHIFVHRFMQEKIPGTFTIQDGDGDVVFTG
jgi:hypothetical protein